MDQQNSLFTLANGLRVAYLRKPGNVAYCGLAINAGSRDDGNLFGLAHFVEHTIFKGTKKRKAWHILNRMERIGGELNAYTTKEETLIYSVFPSGNMTRAVELISDLVCGSIFPEKELEKEKDVVVEEIQSYRDTPSEAIFDDFEDLIFAGSPLGHNILGDESTLESITSQHCMDYIKNLYVPDNMVLFAVDSIPAEKFQKLAELHFSHMNHSLTRPARKQIVPVERFNTVRDFETHQSHTIIGTQTFGMHDADKYSLLLLNNILGGPGMNSTLNISIREKRGYAYTVESSVTLLPDCGLFTIYFGSDERHAAKCIKLAEQELIGIAEHGLSQNALSAAKKQYTGQLIVSSENPESKALSLGKEILYYNKILTIEEIVKQINAVTNEDIRRMGQILYKGRSILTFK